MKPSSFRMKLALAFIPVSGEVGPGRVNASKFPPPASTGNGSICPAGWRHCWGGKDWYARPGVTARDFCRSCSIWIEHSEAIPSTSMWMGLTGTKAKLSSSFSSAILGFILSTFLPTNPRSTNRSASGDKANMKLPEMSGSIVWTLSISDSREKSIIGRKRESDNYAS